MKALSLIDAIKGLRIQSKKLPEITCIAETACNSSKACVRKDHAAYFSPSHNPPPCLFSARGRLLIDSMKTSPDKKSHMEILNTPETIKVVNRGIAIFADCSEIPCPKNRQKLRDRLYVFNGPDSFVSPRSDPTIKNAGPK